MDEPHRCTFEQKKSDLTKIIYLKSLTGKKLTLTLLEELFQERHEDTFWRDGNILYCERVLVKEVITFTKLLVFIYFNAFIFTCFLKRALKMKC